MTAEPCGAEHTRWECPSSMGADACLECREPWPCRESLAAEVARRTEALEAAEAWMTHVLGILSGKGHFAGRIPDADCREDGRMIVKWLRAALGTKGAE